MKTRRLQREPGLMEAAPAAKAATLAGSGNGIATRAKANGRTEAGPHSTRPAAETGIRADKVERARRLIAEVEYPPREVLEKVAQTLMRKAKSWSVVGKGRSN